MLVVVQHDRVRDSYSKIKSMSLCVLKTLKSFLFLPYHVTHIITTVLVCHSGNSLWLIELLFSFRYFFCVCHEWGRLTSWFIHCNKYQKEILHDSLLRIPWLMWYYPEKSLHFRLFRKNRMTLRLEIKFHSKKNNVLGVTSACVAP